MLYSAGKRLTQLVDNHEIGIGAGGFDGSTRGRIAPAPQPLKILPDAVSIRTDNQRPALVAVGYLGNVIRVLAVFGAIFTQAHDRHISLGPNDPAWPSDQS